jgi:hypothetical protein
MVSDTLAKERELKVISIKYGYFDALRFWCPVGTRRAPVREVLRLIRDAMARYPGAEVSVLAHSFGTYAVGRILRDEPDIRLRRLVLCGSVLPRRFRWDHVGSRVREEVINDCGSRDIWPVLAQATSWGYGATGTFGFGAPGVRDRAHDITHSDYFTREFVERYWLPWFRSGTFVPSPWTAAQPPAPWWRSFLTVVPLRWLLVALLLLGLTVLGRWCWRPALPPPAASAARRPPSPPPPPGKLNILAGTVIDSETRLPVAGVTVTIQDLDDPAGQTPTTQTDADGRFRFRDLPPGPDDKTVRLHAHKKGYQPSLTDPSLGAENHYIELERVP